MKQRLFWLLGATACLFLSALSFPITMEIDTRLQSYQEIIERSLPGKYLVSTVSYASDVHFDKAEFEYLTDLHHGVTVDSAMLTRAVSYLIKKNIFEHIQVTLQQDATGAVALVMNLTGFWTLEKLTIRGLWFGKDQYRYIYSIGTGEQFSTAKHADAMQTIKSTIRDEGYLNPLVDDTIVYDTKTKRVRVTVTINKRERFSINHVNLAINNGEEAVRDDIEREFAQAITGKHCTRVILDQEVECLRAMLVKRGYIYVDIKLDKKIDYEHSSVDIVCTIDLNKKREFVFFGNNFFSSSQLLGSILDFGRSALVLPPSILAQELVDIYKQKGFWHISVEPREETGRVFFVIHEGERVAIKDVMIKNSVHISPEQLVKKTLQPLANSSYYDEDVLQRGLNAMTNFYRNEGFFNAAITKQERVALDAKQSLYKYIVTVEEGERFFVKRVTIDRYSTLCQECPGVDDAEHGIAVPYTKDLVDNQRNWIEKQLHKEGKKQAAIKAEIVPHDNHTVDIIWHINVRDHEKLYGKTVIVGNHTLPYDIVMREIAIPEGTPINPLTTKKNVDQLKALNVFDSVSLYPDQANDLGIERALLLNLTEGERFEVRCRAGLGLQQMRWPFTFSSMTYKLGGAFIMKNPTNSGDICKLDLDFTRAHRDVVLQYRRPWIFGLPIRTSLELYSNLYRQQGFFYDRENWYFLSQTGFLASVSGDTRLCNMTTNFGLEWMKLWINPEYQSIEDRIARAFNIDQRLLSNYVPYIFVEPTVIFDYLDHPLNPTYGSFTLLSWKGMLPLARCEQVKPWLSKWLLEQSFFYPLQQVVLMARLRLGYILAQNIRHVFLNERFYLGGAHSLRSYYTDCTPPLGSFQDCNGCTHCVPQGGLVLANLILEARIPIIGNLSGTVFQEFGVLGSGIKKTACYSGPLAATGFGMWYNTPVGPLRCDIGWKWSCQKPFNKSYAWFFSLGHIF